jgi:6-phosphogluconate dehydrogenase
MMKIGFIGLGKMGGAMTERIMRAGHEVVVLDHNSDAVAATVLNGATSASGRNDLVEKLSPVIIWLMIPSQFVDTELAELLKIVPEGSILIDGGNSDFRLSKQRAELCLTNKVAWLDVGTSGGILGFKNGYSLMVGGEANAVKILEPIFSALAPALGWNHFGDSGSGHYVKMVHNAIEYGLMESYAEGYRMLKDGPYKNIDLALAGETWKHGSIVGSLLNDLTVEVLNENPELVGIDGFVAESGETKWALEVANDHGIKMPSIEASMQVRLDSQEGDINYATKLLAAMRNKFGGHNINK